MREFPNANSLTAAVKQHLANTTGGIIAIEGHSTSGKSYLGKDLGTRLGISAIGTDSFVRPRSTERTYLELVDTDRFRSEITRLMSAGAQMIVEGICLRDTLAALAITPKLFIYVKRITAGGLWADDPENELDGSWVDRQSIEYHARETPLERADMIYSRREE